MVLGIVAILTVCCSVYGVFAIIPIACAVVGLALGGVSLSKKYAGKGMAVAGVVCSIIALVMAILILIWWGAWLIDKLSWLNYL